MNFARVSPAVTVLNGYIYVSGGYAEWCSSDDTANSVELYNPKTDEWITIATPVELSMPSGNWQTEVSEM